MKELGKLSELQPWCQWAAAQWLDACDSQGIIFTVTEVYRTQQRQNQLYAQGRTMPGKIVTWTKTSLHTERLAADIIAHVGSYAQIEAVANRFGIYRRADLVKLGDIGHFQFDKAMQQPTNPVVLLHGLINRLKVTKIPYLKYEIPLLIARIKKRFLSDK